MISIKKLKAIIILSVLPLTGFCEGFYFGGSLGQSESKDDTGSASDLIYFTYTNVTSETSDTSDTAYSLFAGYTFDISDISDSSVGVEAAFIDFGENSLVAEGQDFIPGGDGTRTAELSAEADAITISILGFKEFKKDFSFFGRLGFSSWDISGRLTGVVYDTLGSINGTTSDLYSESGTDLYWGFGFDYKMIRFGFDRYDFDGSKTDYLYVGAKF